MRTAIVTRLRLPIWPRRSRVYLILFRERVLPLIERSGNWFRLKPTRRQSERYVSGPLLTEIARCEVVQ